MIPLRILLLDVETELHEYLKHELKKNTSYELLDILILEDSMANYSVNQKLHFDLILFECNTDHILNKCFSNVKSSYLNTQRIIQISKNSSYDSIRSAYINGAYDYWIKPYNFDLIKNTVSKFVSEVYFKISLNNTAHNIQNAIIGKSTLQNRDLKIFFYENITPTINNHLSPQNLYTAFLDLFDGISLNPMQLEKSTIASICASWISQQDNQFLAFQNCIKKVAQVYQEIFIPKAQTPIVRKAIYEVLAPSSHNKTVSYIAKKLYINQSHLSMTFKRHTKISLSEYIKKIKIYGAMLMLLDQNYSIDDILNILGYKDEQHFSKIFKESTGILPISYRQFNHRLLKQTLSKSKYLT